MSTKQIYDDAPNGLEQAGRRNTASGQEEFGGNRDFTNTIHRHGRGIHSPVQMPACLTRRQAVDLWCTQGD